MLVLKQNSYAQCEPSFSQVAETECINFNVSFITDIAKYCSTVTMTLKIKTGKL